MNIWKEIKEASRVNEKWVKYGRLLYEIDIQFSCDGMPNRTVAPPVKELVSKVNAKFKALENKNEELEVEMLGLRADLSAKMWEDSISSKKKYDNEKLKKDSKSLSDLNKKLNSMLLEFQLAEKNALPRKTFRITLHGGTYMEVKAHNLGDSPDEMQFFVNGESAPVYILSKATMLSVEVI